MVAVVSVDDANNETLKHANAALDPVSQWHLQTYCGDDGRAFVLVAWRITVHSLTKGRYLRSHVPEVVERGGTSCSKDMEWFWFWSGIIRPWQH